MKETFIVRTEWYYAIQKLSQEEQAVIFCNLCEYHLGNHHNIKLTSLSVELVWKLIEPNLQRNIESYDKRRETSIINGKLGGRPKKTKPNKPNSKPNQPIETLSDIVTVSVSDYNKYIVCLNSSTGKKYKGCAKSKTQFNARLSEGRTLSDFEQAIQTAIKDEFHKGNFYKYITPEFLTRADKLDKYSQEPGEVKQTRQTIY